MRQSTLQSSRAEHGFGFLRGAEVLFPHSALPSRASVVSLEVGRRVEFEPESGRKRTRTAKIAVTSVETPPVLLVEELAACVQRHAAG